MLAIVGQWVMEQIVGGLREQRVTLTLTVALIILAGFAGYIWADDQHGEFQTKSEAEAATRELKSEIERNRRTSEEILQKTEAHIRDFDSLVEETRIEYAINSVRDAKRDVRLAQNDPNISDRELNELRETLDHAEAYKDCLIERRPNCRHLRLPE